MANSENEILVPGTAPAQTELEHANQRFQTQLADQLGTKSGSFNIDDRWNNKAMYIEHLPGFGIYEGGLQLTAPTPEETKKAQENVDGSISKLLTPQDKQTLQSMQDSLLNGDAKGFANAIQSLRNDPERLKAFIDEMNKNMERAGATTRAAVDKAGNVVVYDGGNKGVEIAPDGSTTVRAIEHGADGSIVMGGEVLNGNGGQVLKHMGNDAVHRIDGLDAKPRWPEITGVPGDPTRPEYPFHPYWPKLPHGGITHDPDIILLNQKEPYWSRMLDNVQAQSQ